MPGGSTDDDWGVLRWLNSRVATLMARPLTTVRDPMSGFFALRKADFDAARDLNPVGYKIALELIVKCGFENVGEVPIAFSDRVYGESKLTFRQHLLYLQHVRRLYLHKFSEAMHLLQFLVVGALGVVVNLAVLTLFQIAGARPGTVDRGGDRRQCREQLPSEPALQLQLRPASTRPQAVSGVSYRVRSGDRRQLFGGAVLEDAGLFSGDALCTSDRGLGGDRGGDALQLPGQPLLRLSQTVCAR